MRSAPSAAFRRLCLGLALLVVSWVQPRRAEADAYPLQTVKTIVDTLKPNVLVVLETAEAMQGLPGENQARYNDVGVDCEEGNRQCRLTGQSGRWAYSGMGKNGMYFGNAPASCTSSSTYTYTSSRTESSTRTTTASATATTTVSGTDSGSATDTATGQASSTVSGTAISTTSGTATASGQATAAATATLTATDSATASAQVTTFTASANAAQATYSAVVATETASMLTTATSTVGLTLTGTVTSTKTALLSGTVSATTPMTLTVTATSTVTPTISETRTGTVSVTGSVTQTLTAAITGSATATGTASKTLTITLTSGTVAAVGTGTNTAVVSTSCAACSVTAASTAAQVVTGTTTVTKTMTVPVLSGTVAATGTGTGTTNATASQTMSATGTVASLLGTGTGSNTAYQTSTPGGTATLTSNKTFTVTSTAAGYTWTFKGTATFNAQATDTAKTITWQSAFPAGVASATALMTATATGTDGSGHSQTDTYTYTMNSTASVTNQMNNITYTYTSGATRTGVGTLTGTGSWSSTQSLTGGGVWVGTGTDTMVYSSQTATTTATTTQTVTVSTYQKTGTASGTVTNSANLTVTGTVSGSATVTGSTTASNSATATASNNILATATLSASETSTLTLTSSSSLTASAAITATVTATATATSATTTSTTTSVNATATDTTTPTDTNTGTQTNSICGFVGNIDPNRCDAGGATPTTTGYCNVSSGLGCSTDSTCNAVKGDFCRYISSIDGSGRTANEPCITASGSPWGSCKHGVVTANTTCASSGDASCNSALSGDFCTEGQPAKMCADSGLWCTGNSDCPGNAGTDLCVGATSRMMTVKRALRRAITDYSDKVSFGFMNTYQGRGLPSTATDATTAIYPYVKLQSCPGSANVTETKLLTRGELEKAGCFDLTNGPASSCTVDYGGNGAINATASLSQITYTLIGVDDSRWGIPRTDGSGKYTHVDASWQSCSSSTILPACEIAGSGTGLYEGSFYSFTYKQGTPIANGSVDGEGSRAHPKYFTTYMGKYYDAGGGNCYNAVDAERTDIVNDGIYGRIAFTGTPYNASNEVGLPWGGSTNSGACDAKTGAIWNSGVVPFMTDTTFNGKAVTSAQKALMMAARLEKASFGGVGAADILSPIACALTNDGAADKYHSAADYMSQVKTNDAANNSGHSPCWSNNIVLVVDGQPNGPGDQGGAVDCASNACAYNAQTNTSLTGCACPAITKAFALAQAGIQTHVVVNAPNSATDTLSWSTRYSYTYAMLWNLAVAGSPNHDGTPSFGTTEDEVYRAIADKIATAAYHFTYTTTGAVPGATTQDPTTLQLTQSSILYDTSVSYPSWKGSVRAFDVTSSPILRWDAATIAANGHPGWASRRVYYADKSNTLVQVNISGNSVGNTSTLHSAGLGATDAEAGVIMEWLLGKPSRGNPTPLMNAISNSTPIVVGQGASNGLNGSQQYSQNTWKRPQLLYVGGDDGMLHAFFAQAGTVTLNGTTYQGGEEAFAVIPNDMLPVITKMYAQSQQKLATDRSEHIFGLASSPKVKDLCTGTGCAGSTGTDWKTVLVMPEGAGGNKPFALDITNVIDASAGLQPSKLKLLWTGTSSTWDYAMGETTSVPAFYFNKYAVSGDADNRVLFASGYPTRTRTGNYTSQGLTILDANAYSGSLNAPVSITTPRNCPLLNRALLGDVALARDYTSAATSQNLLAGYVTDTWGNTFQYVPSANPKLSLLYATSSNGSTYCNEPIYFAPGVAQLDRAPRADTSSKHYIYLVQVTGSAMDPVTAPLDATNFPASQLIVTKVDANVSPPVIVTSYNKLSATGQIILSASSSASAENRICLQSTSGGSATAFTSNMKTSGQSCADVGGTYLPEAARPVGTPTIVLRSDGLGFQAITAWYAPAAAADANNCSSGSYDYGTSYVTVHEFGADGTWFQMAGVTLTSTALTGLTFVGTGLFVDGIINSATPQSISIGETFSKTQQVLNGDSGLDRYTRTSWTERLSQ
jgi:hypothetical protein